MSQYVDSAKVHKYELLIAQVKKIIDIEKKNSFTIRSMYFKEMEKRKELETVLKNCIEDVREEIQKKKNENVNIY